MMKHKTKKTIKKGEINMKAKIVLANTNYDLRGTGLKYLGEGHLDGMCIERFRTNEMTVCRSCEPENGKDRLVISFSPFDGGIPDTSTMIELAESLGLIDIPINT
jgi:hypothetical protein